MTHYTPGGGGYGDPLSRDPAAVVADVRSGMVSIDQAERLYGVSIDPNTLSIRWFPGRPAAAA